MLAWLVDLDCQRSINFYPIFLRQLCVTNSASDHKVMCLHRRIGQHASERWIRMSQGLRFFSAKLEPPSQPQWITRRCCWQHWLLKDTVRSFLSRSLLFWLGPEQGLGQARCSRRRKGTPQSCRPMRIRGLTPEVLRPKA